jgi:HlyD family secretion protein
MSGKTTVVAGVVVVAIAGAAGGGYYWFNRPEVLTARAEEIRARDLEEVVSASGKIQPKRQVNISANTMGKVTRVAVEEGQRVESGQFLLEIDPRSLAGQLQRGEASVAAAQSGLRQARTIVEQAEANLDLARLQLKRNEELWEDGLTTRENLERAQNDVKVRKAELASRTQDLETREQQIIQEQAGLTTTRYNLSQIVISAPMAGIVTRRNIEEGETAVVGTMNNAGTVLLTIADMSVIEAEVEVDETDIPRVSLGQEATITIDAVPDRTFRGLVTEIGNSPIQAATQGAQQGATNFKVVITISDDVPDVRPGFTCTAEIVTALRTAAVAVPIQAMTVREMLFDASGQMVREPAQPRKRGSTVEPTVSAAEPPQGHTRIETEGVFVARGGRAIFMPVTVGIAGERHFEVLSGLTVGEQVITGPFASVRQMSDMETIEIEDLAATR